MSPVILNRLRTELAAIYLDRIAPKPAQSEEWPIAASDLAGVSVRWPRRYEWDAASDWVDGIRNCLKSYIPLTVVDDISQPYKGTVVFEFVGKDKVGRVAIGYSDYAPIDNGCAQTSDLYFKMQFRSEGYELPNVVPGGYVPDGKRLYYLLPKLRRQRDQKKYLIDVYGRFGLNYAREIREAAVGRLTAQRKFGFEGGMKTVSYSEFLSETASSKLCIDMPGLGSFCFRLVNYLAVGNCVIAYPHTNAMHIPLIDREHIVYCKPDMSDLVDLCEYYLTHDEERERIAGNARDYFDRYLHRENLTRYYLRTCLDRL